MAASSSNSKVLIFGATSAIAQACARQWAKKGSSLFLVARDQTKVAHVVKDLEVRGASGVHSGVGEFAGSAFFESMIAQADKAMGGIDICLVAWGFLGEQTRAQKDQAHAEEILQTNFVNAATCLGCVANYFEKKSSGTIAVISSVAGERGRGSNYVYGSAKAGLTAYVQGLRNRLFSSGVKVVTIVPGFVDTPMTATIPNKSFLYAKPEKIGRGIVCAIKHGCNKVYLPWFWRYIMLVIKLIPEGIFKRMKL